MPPKKFKNGETHGYIGDTKYKSKPRQIEHELFLSMVVERDRIWYKEGKYREFLAKRHAK